MKITTAPFIKYIDSSYFGDSDIFMALENENSGKNEEKGRDDTCLASDNSTVFLMSKFSLEIIKRSFYTIYCDMYTTGIRKYKKHRISIGRIVSKFLKNELVIPIDHRSP